ncbi:2Fe-2S iron-sulfur cluster-binding protein [Methylococcus sp. EFPC2]|uniref:2Fe-2S iron-sulfur cluster-binding protein n=1 Tax=Methylococcus sp. EFPC2 TaxID=2812648 RepID=UPI001966E400|nr:2Fe-2S iron-sulfur cluster-binding protein [Methylococcus sp. EFPC2]QSA99308.1 2Fe-2S iron-sulfur cluster binding domain-containing protein [Methylococcus sp. EFPC2]
MASYLRTGIRRNAKTWVTVLPAGKTVEMVSGTRLVDAVLLTGAELPRRCGGHARCGVCHVMVLHGGRGLSKARKDERERIAQIGGEQSQSRLSCQAVLGRHEVTIELVNH